MEAASLEQSFADVIDNNHSASASWAVEFQNSGLLYDWSEVWGPGELGVVPITLRSNAWQHLVISVDSTFVTRIYI